MTKSECKIFGDNFLISQSVLRDKGSKQVLRIECKDDFFVYRVDNGLIGDNNFPLLMIENQNTWDGVNKCDFILIDCKKEKFVFIELKGGDVKHAMNQVLSTYKIVKRKNLESFVKCVHACIIVSSKNHPQNFQNETFRALKKVFRNNISIKNRLHTYS